MPTIVNNIKLGLSDPQAATYAIKNYIRNKADGTAQQYPSVKDGFYVANAIVNGTCGLLGKMLPTKNKATPDKTTQKSKILTALSAVGVWLGKTSQLLGVGLLTAFAAMVGGLTIAGSFAGRQIGSLIGKKSTVSLPNPPDAPLPKTSDAPLPNPPDAPLPKTPDAPLPKTPDAPEAKKVPLTFPIYFQLKRQGGIEISSQKTKTLIAF